MIITDFRSDTVTKPTPAMLQYMMQAPVGDDVYGEDPTVNELQETCARMFGMQAGLFFPSGTMANQAAIKCLTGDMSEVICDESAHIYQYEVGGIAFHSRASVKLVQGERGKMTPQQIVNGIRPENVHFPETKLVALENTCNKGGGTFYTLPEIAAISDVCRQHKLSLHLDGARVFNALVAAHEEAEDYGKYFDSISVCLSKGLGAPVGSVLVGSQELIRKALRVRKVMGGGMRQAGFLAAAGLYALEHHVQRLGRDHEMARQLEQMLQTCAYVKEVMPVETNIVIFRLDNSISEATFLQKLEERNIRANSMGPQMVRFVTHYDITDDMMAHVAMVLKKI